jgi:hypothetical protein
VIPYFGYARQDRKPGGRTPISAKLVANLITQAGADRVLTVDLHAGQIQGFFDIPTDNLFGAPVMARDIKERYGAQQMMVVSPDVGGVVRARALAKRLGADLAIVDKRRERAGESEVMNIIGDVRASAASCSTTSRQRRYAGNAAAGIEGTGRDQRFRLCDARRAVGQCRAAYREIGARRTGDDRHDPAFGGCAEIQETPCTADVALAWRGDPPGSRMKRACRNCSTARAAPDVAFSHSCTKGPEAHCPGLPRKGGGMTALPRVLAMTPAYNGEAFLQRTLESLAAQTYPALRVLIADDASTDATADIAEAHVRRDSRFSLVRRSTNLGWTGNTNAMLKDARGQAEYMLFAFHDDVLFPDYVARLAARLDSQPDAVLAFSDAELRFEDQAPQTAAFTRLEQVTSARARTAIMARMPENWWIPAHGMFRASAAENHRQPEAQPPGRSHGRLALAGAPRLDWRVRAGTGHPDAKILPQIQRLRNLAPMTRMPTGRSPQLWRRRSARRTSRRKTRRSPSPA